jgi:hypothetical protein
MSKKNHKLTISIVRQQVRPQDNDHSTIMLVESSVTDGMQRAEHTHYDRLKDYILG